MDERYTHLPIMLFTQPSFHVCGDGVGGREGVTNRRALEPCNLFFVASGGGEGFVMS